MVHLSSSNLPGLIFVGGKGGVGKTTCAAALAMGISSSGQGKRVLLASTDPAHSLGDSLDMEMDETMQPVPYSNSLAVWQIPARAVMNDFVRTHKTELRDLALRGTIFDQDDIERFFELSLPGIDEMAGVLELSRLVREKAYDHVVVDTAPTGHTLRLLMLPAEMRRWVKLLDLMQEKHRYISKRLTGIYRPDSADRFLSSLERDVVHLRNVLSSRGRGLFIPVLIPESMAIEETQELLQSLTALHVEVDALVVNRVPADRDCRLCKARSAGASAQLDVIRRTFAGHELIEVPLFATEVKGRRKLKHVSKALLGKERTSPSSAGVVELTLPRVEVPAPTNGHGLDRLLDKDLQFVIFGGKGGVGKTTTSVAFALTCAEKRPDKNILLFSTDPAHSLSDSLDMEIGDALTQISPNLFAMETNAARLLKRFKEQYREAVSRLFRSLLPRGTDLAFDRKVMENLADLAPPGLDEVMALAEVKDYVVSQSPQAFDLLVLDMAPSGHLLAFLKTPEIGREWCKTVLRLLLKYKNVLAFDEMAEDVLQLTRDLRLIMELLADNRKTQFVAVAIPEAMSVEETIRLLKGVEDCGIECGHLVVNMISDPSTCPFCEERRLQQWGYLQQLSSRCNGAVPCYVPLFESEIHGEESLRRFARTLFKTAEGGAEWS